MDDRLLSSMGEGTVYDSSVTRERSYTILFIVYFQPWLFVQTFLSRFMFWLSSDDPSMLLALSVLGGLTPVLGRTPHRHSDPGYTQDQEGFGGGQRCKVE